MNPLKASFKLFIVEWVLPALLALLSGILLPSSPFGNNCFIFGLTIYTFYLISIPLTVNAEQHVSDILNNALRFATRNKVLSISAGQPQQITERTNRLSASLTIHLLCLAIAYISSVVWLVTLLIDNINTWHGICYMSPTLPGIYIAVVSVLIGLYLINIWVVRARFGSGF